MDLTPLCVGLGLGFRGEKPKPKSPKPECALTGARGTLGKEAVPLEPFLNLLNCRGSKALRWLADQPRSGR